MSADIVPVLAQVAGIDLAVAKATYAKTEADARAANSDIKDSRTFYLAVEGFRVIHPFNIEDLTAARVAIGAASRATDPIAASKP